MVQIARLVFNKKIVFWRVETGNYAQRYNKAA